MTPPTTTPERAKARRGLFVFLAVVVVGSGAFEIAILRKGDAIGNHPLLVIGLMWTPAFASLVARIALREHPRDVSFGFGGKRGAKALLLAVAYPLLVGGLAYGVAWATGLERFAAPATAGGLATSPALAFAKRLGTMTTLGALFGCITAAGEEIGWRGYMLTRLFDAGLRRPVLVSGLIWAAYHLPLILSGQYAAGRYPILSAALFMPGVVAGAYVAARVRLESGSVWPAVIFHGAWNAIIQGAFDRFTKGGDASHGDTLWTGESGVLVAVAHVLVLFALVVRTRFAWRRTTTGEPVDVIKLSER